MTAVHDLVHSQFAALAPEMEAKISDRVYPGQAKHIDPNHVTTARQRLLAQGAIVETVERTRGKSIVRVYTPPPRRGITRKIDDAAARKRLLMARYISWSTGSKSGGAGAIGPGLERVVHDSLVEAAPHGYRLINPDRGEASTLLGELVRGGPVDNAALFTPLVRGLPGEVHLVVVECKNLRQWIYPRTQELHQLLDKAARLQVAHPQQRIVPVIVCRRAHYQTTVMAKQLGFYTLSTVRQYVRPFIAEGENATTFAEVNDELGFDLVPHDGAVPQMVNHFRSILPGIVERTAQQWQVTAAGVGDAFETLRDDGLSTSDRHDAMLELQERVEQTHGEPAQWTVDQSERSTTAVESAPDGSPPIEDAGLRTAIEDVF